MQFDTAHGTKIFINHLISIIMKHKQLNQLEEEFYTPSQSIELYDPLTDTWYNHSGQQLRCPKEYNQYSDGYTPFGDE